MNNQEIFDYVVAFLRAQGAHAYESGCAYRTSTGGLKCAVGCLIPDDQYDPAMEGYSIKNCSSALKALYEIGVNVDDWATLNLLSALQLIHDDTDVEDWEEEWRMLAQEHNLEYPKP